MEILPQLSADLGIYVAALAAFAAAVAFRANPTRAVNRYFAALMSAIAFWQIGVAVARITRDYAFWGLVLSPIGTTVFLLACLMHDSALHPQSGLVARLRRNVSGLLGGVVLVIGTALVLLQYLLPGTYPWFYRLICVLVIALCCWDLRRGRRRAPSANAYELQLCDLVLVFSFISVAAFLLVRRSSLSGSIFVALYLMWVIGFLCSEKVLDTKGTARVALGHAITALLHCAVIGALVFFSLLAGVDVRELPLWGIAILMFLVIYPVFLLSRRLESRLLRGWFPAPAQPIREEALKLAGVADTERAIIIGFQELGRRLLGGIEVWVIADSGRSNPGATEALTTLVDAVVDGWISPERALKTYRDARLNAVLEAFRQEKLGAVIQHESVRLRLGFFVGQRAGGSKPITTDEIDVLRELVAIAGTGLERVRAVEQNFRDRGLALVGRIAALYSHEARNQLSAVLSLLEALCAGRRDDISPQFCEAVYQQALDLAANHNFALEVARLRTASVQLAETDIGGVVQGVMSAQQQFARGHEAQVSMELQPGPLRAIADAKLLRQVLLNLVRNALQVPRPPGEVPRVELRAGREDAHLFIEVADNGTGVAPDVYDELFAPWRTTKSDGTGLGLSFCLEAMRLMKGEISLTTPRGAPCAVFRLRLPKET